jgi:hypothetical protein
MKIKFFAVFAVLSLFLSSCQKESSEENGGLDTTGGASTGGTGAGGAGGGLAGNLATCKSCAYYPICSGSVYNYSDTSGTTGAATATSFTLTFVKDTTIEGKTYQKMSGAGQQNTFFNCTAGVTTSIVLNGSSQGGTFLPYVKTTTLKANDPVGATWVDVIDITVQQNATYTNTIVAKGISRTVAGITYNDVIQVHQDAVTTAVGFGTIPFSHSDYYLARGTGLIDISSYDDFNNGVLLLRRVLISATIP